MGSLQTRLLNRWKDEAKAKFPNKKEIDIKSVGDINKSIKPSQFNDDWLAVKVNDDHWFNIQLKINIVKGDEEIQKDIKKMDDLKLMNTPEYAEQMKKYKNTLLNKFRDQGNNWEEQNGFDNPYEIFKYNSKNLVMG